MVIERSSTVRRDTHSGPRRAPGTWWSVGQAAHQRIEPKERSSRPTRRILRASRKYVTVTVHVLFIFPMEVTTPLYIVGMARD